MQNFFFYFYSIVYRADRIARELDASAKRETSLAIYFIIIVPKLFITVAAHTYSLILSFHFALEFDVKYLDVDVDVDVDVDIPSRPERTCYCLQTELAIN